MKTYKEKMNEAETLYHRAQQAQEEAEAIKREEVASGGIEAWRGYHFASSSGLTEEWATFSAKMRAHLKKTLAPDFTLISYNRGHFYFSAFIKNNATGKLAYISCSDVRYFSEEWYNSLLIRTAQHDKDYTGGVNGFTTLPKLREAANRLTS